MNNDVTDNEFDFSDLGDTFFSDSSQLETDQVEMVRSGDSDNTIDYSDDFADIITDLETLIGLYDEDVNLADVHHDLVITNFLILFFIVLFTGNKLINKIRSL